MTVLDCLASLNSRLVWYDRLALTYMQHSVTKRNVTNLDNYWGYGEGGGESPYSLCDRL